MKVKQYLSSRSMGTVRNGQFLLAALLVFLGARPSIAFDPLNGDFSRANPLDIRIVAYNHNRSFISNSGKDAAFNRILIALDPDIISFEEFPSSISPADVANRMNAIIPIGGSGWQIHFGLLAGIRTVIASRFPLTMTRVDTVPASSTRGVTLALADLPNADYPVDVYLLAVHLKCCGNPGDSSDLKRQASADAIANWLADARGVARPSGNNIALPANTPMIALGDFNLVGGPQPENTILTGNIQDQGTYGPPVQGDWDVSNLTNLMPADPFTGNTFTWQGSSQFPPSALDRFFITDSVITVANNFVLNTDTMTATALNAAGLQAGDTLPGNTSDHLPIVMDLQIASSITDCNGNGVDDAQDIAAGTSQDCNGTGIPDECEVPPLGNGPDCDGNGVPDECEVPPIGAGADCNGNGVPDQCDPESSDVALFVSQLLIASPDPVLLCIYDKNGDGKLDGADVQLFEESVINGL